MFGVSRCRRFAVALILGSGWIAVPNANAAGVRGVGSAKTSEWKSTPRRSTLRTRALRRARLAALQAALGQLDGPVDDAAKTAVLKDGTRWTGAYRILTEQVDPDGVRLELEVDIDIARLAKFVAPAGAPAPSTVRYHVEEISTDRGCSVEEEQVALDLERLGVARAKVGASEPVAVKLSCNALGPVPNTLLQAVKIRVEAKAGGATLAVSDEAAFGVDEHSARQRGAGAVAESLATALLEDPGGVIVRIESPHPASRVRRLQRAMAEQIKGVREATLVGIDTDGSVRLRLDGRASADAIARALQALSMPDFSITIVGVHDARGLTVRFR